MTRRRVQTFPDAATRANSVPPSSASSYETFFPLNEAAISESSKWRSLSTDLLRVTTSGGFAYGNQNSSVGYDDSYAFLNPSFIDTGPDHYMEATIYREVGYTFPLNQEVEGILRCSDAVGSPGVRTWYEVLWNIAGNFEILYLTGVADSFTPTTPEINNSILPVTGDLFRCQAREVGADTVVSGWVNGSKRVEKTFTGASLRIPTGQPGFAFFNRNAAVTNPKFCYSRVKVGSL